MTATPCDENEYLERHGAGMASMGEPALHRQPGSTSKQRAARAATQAMRDAAWAQRREQLRREYAALVAAGQLRPRTRRERLERTAAGHPDKESTRAARRLLEKMS